VQAALDSSEACFRASIKFAEPDVIAATLLEHTTQCNMAFSMAVERIKRLQAEDDLSCAKLLQAAKEAAQEAFNEAEFTSKALEWSDNEAIAALFEVSAACCEPEVHGTGTHALGRSPAR
jgi:hypothetical protein